MARKDYYYDPNAPKPNSIVAAASAIVTNSDGHILMHKRKDNDKWSLVGGAMEHGETLAQTAIREIKEESGFDVDVKKLIGVYSDPNHIIAYTNGEVRQQFSICFHCKVKGGDLTVSDESHEVKFFSIEELSKIDMHPAQRVRIDDYLSNQETAFYR